MMKIDPIRTIILVAIPGFSTTSVFGVRESALTALLEKDEGRVTRFC
jgi:hypothetical protein